MKITRLPLAVALLAGGGTLAFAQDYLTLLNPPNSGYTEGGVYTSPYNMGVSATQGVAGTATVLICDDFTTDISIGEQWLTHVASITTLNSSTVSPLKFDSSTYNSHILGGTSDVIQDYAIAAVLAGELLALPNTDTADAGALSFAIWDVFDSTLLGTSYSTYSDPYGSLSQSQWSAADTYLTNAETAVSAVITGSGSSASVNLASLGIQSLTAYTPTPNAGVAQEFLQVTMSQGSLVSMPEASYSTLLLLDLVAAAGLILVFRKRFARKSN